MFKLFFVAAIALMLVGCASTSPKFASEKYGLLNENAGRNLNEQAKLGVRSASTIIPLISKEAANNYKTVYPAVVVFSNYDVEKEVSASIGTLLVNKVESSKIFSLSQDKPDIAVYAILSYDLVTKENAIIEVVTAVSDLKKAKEIGGNNLYTAFLKSTVWYSVSRKLVTWKEIEINNKLSGIKALNFIKQLSKSALDVMLIAER